MDDYGKIKSHHMENYHKVKKDRKSVVYSPSIRIDKGPFPAFITQLESRQFWKGNFSRARTNTFSTQMAKKAYTGEIRFPAGSTAYVRELLIIKTA